MLLNQTAYGISLHIGFRCNMIGLWEHPLLTLSPLVKIFVAADNLCKGFARPHLDSKLFYVNGTYFS